ncbi:MAG: GNAT family N-acetyltransferase [Bacteroidota bacterium]
MKTLHVNENIVLRALAPGDKYDIFQAIDTQRDYLGPWLPFVAYTHQIEDTENFVQSILDVPEDQREHVFVIRFNGQFAGIIGFKDTDRINRRTEIGYWLSEDFQKKGIITMSVKVLLHYAFTELDLNRVQIRCAQGNLPSLNIPRRLGFTFEGIERAGELLSNGEFADLEVYSMLRGEFRE